jgi:hypothetical protein
VTMPKNLGALMTVKDFAAELDRIVDEALVGFRKSVEDEGDDPEIVEAIHARLWAWRCGQLQARIDADSDEEKFR